MDIIRFDNSYKDRWDSFIERDSINGTFLQSRRFLDYHPEGRFSDVSLMIMQGSSIVALVPAHSYNDENGKHFSSHSGSTFGGIVIDRRKYNISAMEEMIPLIDDYLKSEGYTDASLAMTSDIFSEQSMDLFDYYFYKRGWIVNNELCTYIDLKDTPSDLTAIMSSSRRRDYRYSLKNNLTFRELKENEIADFYQILCENLVKYDTKPVHTLDELLEFKQYRLKDEVGFYGVYDENNRMLAGSMIFEFSDKVFHTQYLAQATDTLRTKLFPMEFLDESLIQLSRDRGFRYFSFGPSTLDHGRYLNVSLATFKEGFGCKYNNKRTYIRSFE